MVASPEPEPELVIKEEQEEQPEDLSIVSGSNIHSNWSLGFFGGLRSFLVVWDDLLVASGGYVSNSLSYINQASCLYDLHFREGRVYNRPDQ